MRFKLPSILYSILCLSTLSSVAHATITITNGQVTFTMRDGTFTGGAWAADLFTQTGSPDHLFRNQWYYRTENQIMEHQLSSLNNTDEGATGDSGFIEWSESGFDFRLNVAISSLPVGEEVASVGQGMQVTNTTEQTQTIHLFNYADFEFGGFLSSNFASRDVYGIEVTNPSIDGRVGRIETGQFGTQPANWQIDDGFIILDELNDAFVTTLTDSNNQSFDDTSAVLEYTVTVEPGETVNIFNQLQVVQDPFPADLNGDDLVNFFDISVYLDLFGNRRRGADFTNDGLFNFFDVSAFLSAVARDS